MEKRAILAVVLSVIFFIGWNYFVIQPKLERQKVAQDTLQEKSLDTPIDISSKKVKIEKKMTTPKTPQKTFGFTPTDEEGEIIIVQTDLTEVTLVNKGGLIKNLKFKKHLNEEHTPLDLITFNEEGSLPLTLEFSDPALTDAVNRSIFTTSTHSLLINQGNKEGSITFSLKSPSGIEINKIITFYNNTYKIGVQTIINGMESVADINSYTLLWGPGINSGRAETGKYTFEGATTFIDDEPVNNSKKDLKGTLEHKGNLLWTALQNKFFTAVLVPETENVISAIAKKDDFENMYVGLSYKLGSVPSDNTVMIFAGPKEFDRIRSYDLKLERLIDYGIIGNTFKFLVNPIFVTLKLFYRISHNYGLSIIILTILIKLIFLPLSQKSYKSMEKTKKMQPQLKLLQERYKNDKTKLNEEMMKFYKENKINPLGGCLPMLVQIPVFFALYNVLLHSVELRHAPFIFWITDLSVKDPFYVTPVLMGVTMLIQQRMTPSTGDPIQAKMMMFMPVIFTVMFLSFPVGLVIYWLINNLMTILQQYLIAKKGTA